MTDPYRKSGRRTSPTTISAIFSPGSAAGPWLCGSPAPHPWPASGPEASPASPLAAPAGGAASATAGTSGRSGATSSANAALGSSLASRLRRQLDSTGSILFTMTWSEKATPAGRPYSRLAASARPTGASGSIGWPSAARATPTSQDNPQRKETPQASDRVEGSRTVPGNRQKCLGRDLAVSGPAANGSSASTEKPGQFRLNPRFSLWLQGFPETWASFAPRGTRSASRRRRRSSRPRSGGDGKASTGGRGRRPSARRTTATRRAGAEGAAQP
jgi:hypothetical protein